MNPRANRKACVAAGARKKKGGVHVQQIVARDGTRIGYTVHGEGDPAVVLSNGIGCRGWPWRVASSG